MARPLTAIAVAKARPRPARREIADGGCTGLYLIVQPSGVKSFAARYRSRGRSVKLTLGSALIGAAAESGDGPQIGAPLSLAAARELCARVLRESAAGRDPAAEKRLRRKREREAQADTLEAICREYLRRRAPELRTGLSQRRPDLELFYGSLGQSPIDQIRRSQVTLVLDRISDERGPVRADRAMGALRALFNWHAARGDFISPLGRTFRRTSTHERSRTRILDDGELRRLWLAAEQAGVFGAYLRFLLLTATRRSEAGGLRRGELSADGASWTIPGARYKNGKDTLIPLSTAAAAIIAAMPVLPGGDYVFGVNGRRALGGYAERKAEFDKASGVTGWRLHDLRRTARTLLSRAGIAADIAERALGHVPGGVRGVYDRHAYEAEKRHAFESLAARIARIVYPPADVVVPLARAKRGRRK
jgi:integrase